MPLHAKNLNIKRDVFILLDTLLYQAKSTYKRIRFFNINKKLINIFSNRGFYGGTEMLCASNLDVWSIRSGLKLMILFQIETWSNTRGKLQKKIISLHDAKITMSDSQWYHRNFYLINIVKGVIVLLGLKGFNSNKSYRFFLQ